MSNSDFEKRIESESRSIGRITNADLVCRDCIYRLDDSERLGNTSQCKRYIPKPNQVLLGRDCEEYRKEPQYG